MIPDKVIICIEYGVLNNLKFQEQKSLRRLGKITKVIYSDNESRRRPTCSVRKTLEMTKPCFKDQTNPNPPKQKAS